LGSKDLNPIRLEAHELPPLKKNLTKLIAYMLLEQEQI
jgi:hypothetical protein